MSEKIFKLAIVGSSSAPDTAYDFVKDTIKKYVTLVPQVEIVSGGARGIDTLAERVANDLGLKFTVFKPVIKDWLGEGGYRERNIRIAEYADMVISMPMPYTGNKCYHCNTRNHNRTGGCWTAKFAQEKGKAWAIATIPQIYLSPSVN